MYTGMEILIG